MCGFSNQYYIDTTFDNISIMILLYNFINIINKFINKMTSYRLSLLINSFA